MICKICSASKVSKWSTGLYDMRYEGNLKSFDYLICEECNLIWQSELEKIKDLSIYYPKNYETHEIAIFDENVKFHRHLLRLLSLSFYGYKNNINVPNFIKHLFGSFVGWLDKTNKMIDIGCGSGYYLSKMSFYGVQTIGYDFDHLTVEGFRKSNQKVKIGGINEAINDGLANSSVTLHHVIEHLKDPLNEIRLLLDAMTVGEQLIIITPNTNSLLFKEFESLHWHMDAPRHTVLFSIDSMKKLCENLNLDSYELFTSNRSFFGCLENSYFYKFQKRISLFNKMKYLIKYLRGFNKFNGDEIILKIIK